MSDFDPQSQESGSGHEERDVRAGLLTLVTGGVLLGIGLVLLAASVLLKLSRPAPFGSLSGEPVTQFPGAGVRPAPAEDLKEYLERQHEELTTYGWVDRSQGIVRIPVEQAMDKIVLEGLPETWEQVTRLDMLERKRKEANDEVR